MWRKTWNVGILKWNLDGEFETSRALRPSRSFAMMRSTIGVFCTGPLKKNSLPLSTNNDTFQKNYFIIEDVKIKKHYQLRKNYKICKAL